MAQEIDINITLEGGQLVSPFNYLSLSQQINGHHSFTVGFNHDVLEQKNAVILENAKTFLGKLVVITFKTKHPSGYPDHVFKGIITEIGIDNNLNSAGDLHFKGYSPTFLLEGGEHCASFLQVTLDQIINQSVAGIRGGLLSVKVSPKFKSTIPYSVQYKESAFGFINRLAHDYGEWFFYDGTDLLFGKPSSSDSITLQYPGDISNLNLNLRTAPLNFTNLDYFSKNNEKLVSESASQKVSIQNRFGDFSLAVSNDLFQKKVQAYSEKKLTNKGEIDDNTKIKKAAKAAHLISLSASSDSPYVRVGVVVKISANKAGKLGSEDFGEYIVINVTHTTDGLGNYHNTFEAVPFPLDVLPAAAFRRPVAEPQLAIVKQNKDPDNLGRIKVQFLWQADNETSPWIRVMGHHAGTLTGGAKNRGLFFTPEIDDYVVVGFGNNDPDRPFVMGSVSHGSAVDSSANTDNHLKYIRTRSGNTIQFKDEENKKKQEILIQTDDGNLISIFTDNAKGLVKIKSSKDIIIESDKTILIQSDQIDVKAKNISVKASEKIAMEAKEITINAQKKLSAESAEVKMESSMGTVLKGGLSTEISATLVKIN